MRIVILFAFFLHPGRGAGCSGGKCNSPTTYTAMSIDPAGAAPVYVTSTGFSSSWLTGIQSGANMVRNFLGTATGNKFFLYGANEAASNYDAITTALCEMTQPDANNRQPDCGAYEKNAAMNFQHPAYMVSGRNPACTCGDYTVEVAPIIMRPSPSDTASTLWELTGHEYVHAVQKAFGGPMPGWLMEGGAVQMQCVMGSIRPAEYGGPVAYSECFRTGGGRSPGIIPNTRTLYSRSDAVNWLTLYGADRACPPDAIPPYEQANPLPTDEDFRYGDYIYYDSAAVAVAFAIHRSGKTTSDFWRNCSGFWHSHTPYGNMNYNTGWESDVPEGQGWRKALADFTGYATSAEFFTAFENFVRPGGTVASEAAILAILESDSSIATQAATAADFAARGPLTSCSNTATAGCSTGGPTPTPSPTPAPTPGSSNPSPTPTTASTSSAAGAGRVAAMVAIGAKFIGWATGDW